VDVEFGMAELSFNDFAEVDEWVFAFDDGFFGGAEDGEGDWSCF
jgi:hypothetical protein